MGRGKERGIEGDRELEHARNIILEWCAARGSLPFTSYAIFVAVHFVMGHWKGEEDLAVPT